MPPQLRASRHWCLQVFERAQSVKRLEPLDKKFFGNDVIATQASLVKRSCDTVHFAVILQRTMVVT